jgi:hypothetical protein
MSKYTISIVTTFFILTIFIFSSLTNGFIVRGDIESYHGQDYDPFIDIILSFEVISIRGYAETDDDVVPNFSIILNINDEQFLSPSWGTNRYLYDINWTVNKNVPDNNSEVVIKIQLIDDDTPCDIGGSSENNTAEIIYDVRTNHWFGDDFIGDPSGYGRLNGCDDGSYYEEENDCEIWFNIYQNDFDNDTIPTWAEINLYGSDPFIDNSNDDFDNDGIPYYWEHHWNYEPYIWDDHESLDPDDDGLTNIEEFMTSEWFSDPYRRDLFIELDQMDYGPNGEGLRVPNSTKDLLSDRYNPRNIVYHLDDGCMGGGEIIPFDYLSWRGEILDIYDNYFLHNDPDNWRRGVFRYAVFIHDNFRASAYAFVGEGRIINSNVRGINSFQITTTSVNKIVNKRNVPIDFICACFIMHETGHTLGIDIFNPFGCDSTWTTRPWRLPFWIFHNYKSVMNYKYTFSLLDYSDGSHGFFDHDDWSNLDFTWFQFREK